MEKKETEPIVPVQEVNLELAAANLNSFETNHSQLEEGNVIEWYNKGLLLYSEEKFTEALSCYNKALSIVG
ncbi:MAG: tetratricopeptide repeat protein, partial [Candidatus Thermoplasmatota archaeon]|nr:tetratricopeptide repeat protein [Candidatus Thermoplasmatota archaeon]